MDLQGKVAVVTGGNSGIGLSSAKELRARGARLVIFGRNATTLEQARQALGGDTLAVQGDVTNVADLERLFVQVNDHFGKVDVLFVNAGRTTLGGIGDVTEENFDAEMSINLKGAFFTVQKALPLMGEGGSIIFNSSCMADMAIPGSSVYTASKAAINQECRQTPKPRSEGVISGSQARTFGHQGISQSFRGVLLGLFPAQTRCSLPFLTHQLERLVDQFSVL